MPVTRPHVALAAAGLLAATAVTGATAQASALCTLASETVTPVKGPPATTNSTHSTNSTKDSHVSPTATTPPAPLAVTNLLVTAGDGSAAVSWTAATGGAQAPLSYYLRTDPFGEYSASVSGSATEGCTITGLTNGTTYTVSVAARGSSALSPAVVSAPFTPQAPVPATPELPVVQQPPAGTPSPVVKAKKAKKATVRLSAGRHRGGNRLTVRWKARHTGHVRLTWRRGAGKPHSQRTSPSGRITLAGPPGTRYTIRVQAGTARAHRTYRIS